VWPYLHQVVNAFGPQRLMWGSDFTRLRWIPVVGGLAPRDQWHYYSDSVNYLRDTTELSQDDKAMIFSGTIRRVLRWQVNG
jgi:predicted TIM-barrel fold metal-dependent hydrolase